MAASLRTFTHMYLMQKLINVTPYLYKNGSSSLLCKVLFEDVKYATRNTRTVSSQSKNSSSVTTNERNEVATADKFGKLRNGPSLEHFIANSENSHVRNFDRYTFEHPYVPNSDLKVDNKKVYIETYGCQMNVNDTELVWSILQQHGYQKSLQLDEADVVLLVTCAIRDSAELKIWSRLKKLKYMKEKREKLNPASPLKVGVLGCMAERLKTKLIEKEKSVDLVAGPDSYRDLPRMLVETHSGKTAVNIILSWEETYADIMPVRINQGSVSAFVSVMRGCDNMCAFCIVPFTRGRERSRPITSIVEEVKILSDQGIKEVTLLGQNVNSYRDTSETSFTLTHKNGNSTNLAPGFSTIYKNKKGGIRFTDLLDKVSRVNPEMRIRFTSPHPKDFPEEMLHLIKERPNICKQLHLPAQCGSTRVLESMMRGYTREAYLQLVDHIRSLMPGVYLTSDIIVGFCGETNDDFEQTLSLLEKVKYNFVYAYPYSMREKTRAARNLVDDVPFEEKNTRMHKVCKRFRAISEQINSVFIGSVQLVLLEGNAKRSTEQWAGRTDGGTKVVIPSIEIPTSPKSSTLSPMSPGNYVAVRIQTANSQVLTGEPLYHTTLQDFNAPLTHL